MEYVKAFGKGWLKGTSLTGLSLCVLRKYDSLVNKNTPKWLRFIVELGVGTGVFYCGLKTVEAAEKYLEENE